MRAVQYRQAGAGPEIVEIPTPEPEAGQVRLKVTAAGLCHSDWSLMNSPAEQFANGLPFTLGHEVVGVVDRLGAGVQGVEVGASYAVYGPSGCGQCRACVRGEENHCPHAAELGIVPPGLGADGGLSDYMIVEAARYLVPIGDLDPVAAVSLTDAGLTPYNAVSGARQNLFPGAVAVVIGVGGLGHLAVQILKATTAATIIAVDLDPEKRDLALEVGAHHAVAAGPDAGQQISELTSGANADAVFDFVGNQITLDLARGVCAVGGHVSVIGIGGGMLPVGFEATPLGVTARLPFWGSRNGLIEVLDLARRGEIKVHTETFAFDQVLTAYEKLRQGELRGRAVIVF